MSQTVTFDDFSGGITDNYITNDLNKSQLMENFIVTDNKKLRTRPGSAIIDPVENQLDTEDRVSGLFNFQKDTVLMMTSVTSLYVKLDGVLTEILGPSSNVAFSAGDSSALPAFAEWKGHVFATNDAGAKTVKAYQDVNSEWQVLTAGLPSIADDANYVEATALASLIAGVQGLKTAMLRHYESGLAQACIVAAALKTVWNAHVNDVSMHKLAHSAAVVSAANPTDLASLATFAADLIAKYTIHRADFILASAWVYHYAQEVDPPAVSASSYGANLLGYIDTLRVISGYLGLHETNDATVHNGHGLTHPVTYANSQIWGQHATQDLTSYNTLNAIATPTTAANVYSLLAVMAQTYAVHYADANLSTPAIHQLGSKYSLHEFPLRTSALLTTNRAPSTFEEAAETLLDLKVAYNKHTGNDYAHGTAFYGFWGGALSNASPDTLDPTYQANLGIYTDYDATAIVSTPTNGPYCPQNLASVYGVANALKSAINTHKNKKGTSPGFVHNAYTPLLVTASDATSMDTLAALVVNIILVYKSHTQGFYEITTGHDAAAGSAPYQAELLTDWTLGGLNYQYWMGMPPGAVTDQLAALNAIRVAYNVHQTDKPMHQNSDSFVNLDPVPTNTVTFADYEYAFHYEYPYNVLNTQRITVGPVLQKLFSGVSSIDTNTLNLAGIPSLANGVGDNYDTSNIRVWIFRTIDGGSVFYKVGDIANGVTTFSDTTPDSLLTENETIYTNGDLPEHTPPPLAKYIAVSGDVGFYLNITENDEDLPNRLRQSIPGIIDACPGDFFIDLDEPGMGVGSTKGRVVAFSNKGVYRVDGRFDEIGNGAMVLDQIHDTDGLASHLSIVQIENGLLFAGNYGFYFTDGYQVTKLSQEFNARYAALVNKSGIYGAYDKVTERVYWSVKADSDSADNDTLYVLHLMFDSRECFTTWTGGDSFSPSSLAFFGDQLIRGDSRGYLFKHDSAYTTDPLVDLIEDPANFHTQAIVYDWKGIYTNCGTDEFRKWGTRLTLKAEQITNLSIQPISNTDLGKSSRNLKPILFHSTWTWGDPLIEWGDPELLWDYEAGIIESWRRMPNGTLRFGHRQFELTNAHCALWNSDATSLGTTAVGVGFLKTLTLVDAATYDWPTDPIGYFLAFEWDDFVTEYAITERTTADTLTFNDPAGTAPSTGNVKWVLRGVPKQEVLALLSVQMDWDPISKSFTPFLGGTQGENV